MWLQGTSGMNVVVVTPNATLELPAALVEVLASAGQDLSITVERGDAAAVSSQIGGVSGAEGFQVLGTPTVINTAITGNTNVIVPLAGITFPDDPAERESFLANLTVFAIHSDGERTIRPGEIVYNTDGNPMGIKFTVNKFMNNPSMATCYFRRSDY